MLNVTISIMLTFRNCEQSTFWKSLFESPAEQPGGAEMCYQTRDYSPSHLSKFVNLGVDHWTGPPRPSTPFVKAAHWSGARDKFLWKVLLTPIRCQIWGMEWRGDLDCNRGWLRGFPRLPQYCGAACGLPPIGAILTSDGANPGLQGAGSVSGRRSSYTFMYCPYYPTAAHSLPDRSPGKRNCNHCESCWIRTSDLMRHFFRRIKFKIIINETFFLDDDPVEV